MAGRRRAPKDANTEETPEEKIAREAAEAQAAAGGDGSDSGADGDGDGGTDDGDGAGDESPPPPPDATAKTPKPPKAPKTTPPPPPAPKLPHDKVGPTGERGDDLRKRLGEPPAAAGAIIDKKTGRVEVPAPGTFDPKRRDPQKP